MIKNCKKCSAQYEITQEDLAFYDKVSPVFNWEKCIIPAPTICSDCRHQKRLSFRNERKFYKRRCNATEKNIISIYSVDKPLKAYEKSEWWSDKWSWLDYWMEVDLDKSFFKQLKDLLYKMPQVALNNTNSENSEYTNQSWYNKNCYLLVCCSNCESCHYWTWIQDSVNCIDCLYTEASELCYELTNGKNCYKCFHSQNLSNCSDCFFSNNLNWCKNCFWCKNLSNKEYCIFNKQYTKEEYIKYIDSIWTWSYESASNALLQIEEHSMQYPNKFYQWVNIYNSTWDYIQNTKNSIESFNCRDSEDIKFCRDAWKARDSYDLTETLDNEVCMELEWCWWNTNSFFSLKIERTDNVFYSMHCYDSNNLFGCIWLRNKSFCILNKQYTKEEYEMLVPKIIDNMKSTWEWGEFFSIELSPFAYNETVAHEYFPLSKETALKDGWIWKEEDNSLPKMTKTIPANKLPDSIKDIPDDILNWAIQCEVTWRPFKIIPQELKFYREYNLPIPHLHPDERNAKRMKLRNPRKLYDRQCMKCQKDIQTTYSPNDPKTVYCEECYLKEIY